MYGLDLLTKQEHVIWCAIERFKEEGATFLEEHGKLGKLYLAALTNDKDGFEEIYQDYQYNSIHCEY